MIKDFIPARTNLASGVVIKQHLLERNKYPQPQASYIDETITGSLTPQWNDYNSGTIEHFDGGAAGVVNGLNNISNISQSWQEIYPTISGSVIVTHNTQDEFYNGEYSGSLIVASTQSITSGDGLIGYNNQFSQSLLNNMEDARVSTKYQDIDYTSGITTPVNFDLLISGSASRATVQDSNYTTLRHIRPRYTGVKNSTQYINEWTNSSYNIGNYGKTPSIESLQNSFAYSDNISSSIPVRMDTSQANLKYLIDENSGVTIPNQSQYSLYQTQDTFITNKYLSLSNTKVPSPIATSYLPIVRGGYRLEPVLYNQVYIAPDNIQWAEEILLIDSNVSGSVVEDYTALIGKPLTTQTLSAYQNWTVVSDFVVIASGSNAVLNTFPSSTSTVYEIDSILKNNNVDILFESGLSISIGDWIPPTPFLNPAAEFAIFDDTLNIPIRSEYGYTTPDSIYDPIIPAPSPGSNSGTNYIFPFRVLSEDLVIGNTYSLRVKNLTNVDLQINPTTYLNVTQDPLPNGSMPTAGLWISSSGTLHPNSIYTSQSALISLYNSPGVKQNHVTTSSFPPVTEDWSIKPGDEFRFDGNETHTFLVKNAQISSSQLIVTFDKPVPPYPAININHFVIRRYVPDASQVIFVGKPPTSLIPPYLVKPKFVTEKLNKDIQIIVPNLIKDGLIT